MDFWQTRHIETLFQQYLLNEVNTQARRDRVLLDSHFRAQEHSVKLLTQMMPLVQHVQTTETHWTEDVSITQQWYPDHRPPWFPPRSVMHSMVYAPYILLLDAQQNLRESFYRDEGLPPLPDTFLQYSLPNLLTEEGSNSITEEANGMVYLVTTSVLLDTQKKPRAFLVLVSPMNDDFLTIFHGNTENNDLAILIHGDTNRVFASSRPDKVVSGTALSDLPDHYIIVGKRFLDYGFSSNILIHFATLIPDEELRKISNAILDTERKQRAVSYAILAALFIVVVFLVARSLHLFTQKMVDISIKQLKMNPKTVTSGDQLLMMQEQFYLMTDEILRTRQQEEARQTEMQRTNDALHRWLVVIKRTQSQLVESEKMASLGGLVAGIAHEINTPVGTSITASSFLESKGQTCAKHVAEGTLRKSELDVFLRDVIESTQMILTNLLRAAELIRSFKQVAVDRTSEEQRSFLIQEYIHHVLLSLRPRLKKTAISVSVQCPESLNIHSYPGAFSQIITNLVVNSLVHAFPPDATGEILFQVTMEGDDILFHYSDNGQGMEEEHRLQIFEPFFTTARHRGGSGLGMHIVFNLVTQTLQGTIHCDSSPGRGTAFKIRIPLEAEKMEVS